MTKRARFFLFFASILIFLVLSYFFILFAYGYKLDLQDLKWVKTGSLLVKTNLGDTDVFVNERLAGKSSGLTATFIKKNLLPASYNLRIEKEGYPFLTKNIEIVSGEVAQFIHLYLPDSQEIRNFLAKLNGQQDDETPYFINKKDGFLYKREGSNAGQAEKLSAEPVYIKDYVIRPLDNEVYLVSRDLKAPGVFLLSRENWENIYDQAADNVILSPDKKKLAVISPNEINVLWLKDESEPPYFKKNYKELVLRISQKIKQAFWYKTSWHLIYLTDGNETHFIELDPSGGRNDVRI